MSKPIEQIVKHILQLRRLFELHYTLIIFSDYSLNLLDVH